MPHITIEIPPEHVDRAIRALCIAGGYAGDPDDQAARHEFARSMIRAYVRTTVQQVEQRDAAEAALAAVTPPDPIDVD